MESYRTLVTDKVIVAFGSVGFATSLEHKIMNNLLRIPIMIL